MTAQLLEVPLDRLYVDPANPRRGGAGDVTELAASIADVGILNPLLVRVSAAPDRYGILSGQRRLAAARQAGLEQAPCVVHDPPDETTARIIATAENVGRKAMNPIEDARSFRQILDETPGMTQAQLAERLGTSQYTISTRLQLLELPAADQTAIAEGRLSASAAYDRFLRVRRPPTPARRRTQPRRTVPPGVEWAGWIDEPLAAEVHQSLVRSGRGTVNGDTPERLIRRGIERELARPSCWVPECYDDALSGGRFCPHHLDLLPALRHKISQRAIRRGEEPSTTEVAEQAVELLLAAPWLEREAAHG